LRNENNYEALLIAHEFNHVHMSDLFTQFTLEMCEGARRSLRTTAQLFRQYLMASSGLPSGARPFIADYVGRRILAPVGAWYGEPVARELRDLLSPLRVEPLLSYSPEVDEINSAVDFAIFDPKAGLMNDFRGKVQTLRHLVRRHS